MAIQFNSKSFKTFRDNMAKFHEAEHGTKDYLGSLQATIVGDEASLKRNEEALANLLAGDTRIHESKESLETIIETFKKQLENHATDKKNATDKRKKAEEDAKAMVTDELYKAYKSYIEEKGNGDAQAYAQAWADWFMTVQTGDNKVEVKAEDCMGYLGYVSSMNDGKSQVTGMLRKAKAPRQFEDEMLKTLADNLQMQKIIAPHKYAYVPVKMRKKSK